jgi:hypothetical protein
LNHKVESYNYCLNDIGEEWESFKISNDRK